MNNEIAVNAIRDYNYYLDNKMDFEQRICEILLTKYFSWCIMEWEMGKGQIAGSEGWPRTCKVQEFPISPF